MDQHSRAKTFPSSDCEFEFKEAMDQHSHTKTFPSNHCEFELKEAMGQHSHTKTFPSSDCEFELKEAMDQHSHTSMHEFTGKLSIRNSRLFMTHPLHILAALGVKREISH
jgi:hypothetical protein